MCCSREMDVTRKFPLNVIVEVPRYYAIFEEYFQGAVPDRADFDELLRQIVHGLMNYPFAYVMDHIGVTLPDPNLMRDKRWHQDHASLNKLSLAAGDITAMLYRFFNSANLVGDDGTLPYTPRNIHPDIMLLDYVSG
jgi:hypothetical protein